MSDKKLLTCPFCDGEAKIEWESWPEIAPMIGTYKLSVNHTTDCMFVCMNGTNYRSEMISNNKEKLAEIWNTRKPMQRMVEKLRKEYHPVVIDDEELFWNRAIYKAIEIVKEEGGLNDSNTMQA